jgi:hypothetical protein
MFQNIQTAAMEQSQELQTMNDVTVLATKQIEKNMPLDKETAGQFQQVENEDI